MPDPDPAPHGPVARRVKHPQGDAQHLVVLDSLVHKLLELIILGEGEREGESEEHQPSARHAEPDSRAGQADTAYLSRTRTVYVQSTDWIKVNVFAQQNILCPIIFLYTLILQWFKILPKTLIALENRVLATTKILHFWQGSTAQVKFKSRLLFGRRHSSIGRTDLVHALDRSQAAAAPPD